MNIGSIKQNDNGIYMGRISTLAVAMTIALRAVNSPNPKAPRFEVHALGPNRNWVQVGALFELHSNNTGEVPQRPHRRLRRWLRRCRSRASARTTAATTWSGRARPVAATSRSSWPRRRTSCRPSATTPATPVTPAALPLTASAIHRRIRRLTSPGVGGLPARLHSLRGPSLPLWRRPHFFARTA
jgi:hypothetical protein